jgi:hypothetical protein
MVAIHHNCHKFKTKIDHEFILKYFKKFKKQNNNIKLTHEKNIQSLKNLYSDKLIIDNYINELNLLYKNEYMKRIKIINNRIKKYIGLSN